MAQLIPVATLIVGIAIGAAAAWLFLWHRIQSAAAQASASAAQGLAVMKERAETQQSQLQRLNEEREFLVQQLEQSRNQHVAAGNDVARLTATLTEERQQSEILQNAVEELKGELTTVRDAFSKLQNDATALTTTLDKERQQHTQQVALLDEAQRKLTDAFKALASDALRSNNESFLNLAQAALSKHHQVSDGELEKRQQAIQALVTPVSESIGKVEAKLAEIETARAEAYGGLKEQVTALLTSEQKLQRETAQLVQALRAPVVRGRWGEIQLRRVVELAGMIDHCDFYEQPTVQTEDRRLRPDMRVRLPGLMNIIVDAKVPLIAFLEAMEATDEATRIAKLRDHARHVVDHIEQLGKKAYWEQFQPSPELVVMFLPGEHFYTAALEQQPDLIERGVDQNVVVATPMTLISLLRAVAIGWRQERLAQSAEEISKLGKELYERLAKMSEHFARVGKNLGQAIDSYNQTLGTLENRVLVTARRFRDLGAGSTDEIELIEVIDKTPRSLAALEFITGAITETPKLPGVQDAEQSAPTLFQK